MDPGLLEGDGRSHLLPDAGTQTLEPLPNPTMEPPKSKRCSIHCKNAMDRVSALLQHPAFVLTVLLTVDVTSMLLPNVVQPKMCAEAFGDTCFTKDGNN